MEGVIGEEGRAHVRKEAPLDSGMKEGIYLFAMQTKRDRGD